MNSFSPACLRQTAELPASKGAQGFQKGRPARPVRLDHIIHYSVFTLLPGEGNISQSLGERSVQLTDTVNPASMNSAPAKLVSAKPANFTCRPGAGVFYLGVHRPGRKQLQELKTSRWTDDIISFKSKFSVSYRHTQ